MVAMMRGLMVIAFVCAGASARADDTADITKLVGAQLDDLTIDHNDRYYLPDTALATVDEVRTVKGATSDQLKMATAGFTWITAEDVSITRARDGKSAWASFVAKVSNRTQRGDDPIVDRWRVSELIEKTDAGWRVLDMVWSQGVPDDQVNAAGRAVKLRALTTPAAADPTEVVDAMKTVVASGFAKPDALGERTSS